MARPDPIMVRHLEVPLPAAMAAAPTGYHLLDASLADGLPARFALSPTLTLALVVPTGLARPWLRADPDTVVSADDQQPGSGIADAGRVPVRLVLLTGDRRLGATPLVRGAEVLLPSDPALPAEIALLPLGWRVTAGAMVGPGSTRSWLRLAWRRVGEVGA
jgi:hypothetical protein